VSLSSLQSLTSLVGSLSELGIVKKHLFRASREILLAVESLLGFADQYTSKMSSDSDGQDTLNQVIRYAQKTIKSVAKQLPRDDEGEYQRLHRKVLRSILAVLEGEIKKMGRQTGSKAKMKLDVYEAIRNVLLKEIHTQEVKEEGSDEHVS